MQTALRQFAETVSRKFSAHVKGEPEVALRTLETPFGRKDLGRGCHCAADLLRKRLAASATIIPFRSSQHVQ